GRRRRHVGVVEEAYLGMDECGCKIRLDPSPSSRQEKANLHSHTKFRKKEKPKPRDSPWYLEGYLGDSETGTHSLPDEENRPKGKVPRSQVALAWKSYEPRRS